MLMATVTVQEAIEMSARLRLPPMHKTDFDHHVQGIMAVLGLSKSSKTLVGSERRKGISGGERKRTSIATDVICNPSILFLDEPTSGLDSRTQLAVMHRLKRLCRLGRTIGIRYITFYNIIIPS